MKQVIAILIVTTMLSSCGNSNESKAIEQAKEIQSTVRAGTIATSAAGYTLTAKINGKEWRAASMMPPEAAGRIIGYKDNEYIGLPYDKRNFQTGKKIVFSENNAADLSITEDGLGMYGGRKGEMEITGVGDNWMEAKFFFTGTTSGSNKIIEVTDGFVRIQF